MENGHDDAGMQPAVRDNAAEIVQTLEIPRQILFVECSRLVCLVVRAIVEVCRRTKKPFTFLGEK